MQKYRTIDRVVDYLLIIAGADEGIDFDNYFIVENVEYSSGNVETFINPARYPNLGKSKQ